MTDPLTPREQTLLEQYRQQYGDILPGGEKAALWLLRQDRDATRRITLRAATTYQMEHVQWLWDGRIPLGELTILAGKGGEGKSTILAQFAAWITTGQMHGAHYGTPRPILYVVNEDSIAKTVLPRMVAAGADISLVHFVEVSTPAGQDALQLPRDGERIMDALDQTGSIAFFVDPLSANISAKKNDQGEMRQAFQGVRRIAEITNTAAVGLGHSRKAMSTDLVSSLMGSSEQGNVARAVLGVCPDPDDDGAFLLSVEKNNLGRRDIHSYRYRLVTAYANDTYCTSKVEWIDKTDMKVSDVLADQVAGQGSTSEAVDWLRTYLTTQGRSSRKDLIADAQKEGISRAAIGRAKIKLKVRSVRASHQGGAAQWELPPVTTGSPDHGRDAHPETR